MMLSDLIATLEFAWGSIESHHPELPEAVIVIGSAGRSANKLGHFCSKIWEDNHGDLIHEVLVSAEYLNRSAEEVMTTLMHEACHAINNKRGIKDVSGKRHNKKFAMACRELGLEPPARADAKLGLSAATLTVGTSFEYRKQIDDIAQELKLVRKLNTTVAETEPNSFKLVCNCEPVNIIRVGKKFIKDEAIAICKDCQFAFEEE